MSNSVEYTQKRPDGDTLKSTLTYINEDAADTDVSKMVGALSSLSKNTLTAIERVEGEEVPLNTGYTLIENGDELIIINDENSTQGIPNGGSTSKYKNKNFNVINSRDQRSMTTSANNDTVHNSGNKLKISADKGDDYIVNTGDSVSISAFTGDDYIYNTGDNVSIDAGAGDDTVYNTGDKATVSLSAGNDSAYNTGDSVRIFLNGGDTSLYSTGDNVSINASLGNVSVTSTGDNVSIYGVSPTSSYDSKIYNSGSNATLSGGNKIYNAGDDSKINRFVYLENKGDRASINNQIYSLNSTVINDGSEVTIRASDGNKNDFINNTGDNVSIITYAGDDTVYNTGDNVSIITYEGDDTVYNTGDNVSINTGEGDDTVTNNGSNVSINAGAGNDSISNNGSNVSILAGSDNDSIVIKNHPTFISTGLGQHTVSGFALDQDYLYIPSISSYSNVITGASLNAAGNAVIYGSNFQTVLEGVSSGTVKYKLKNDTLQEVTIAPYTPEEG